MGPWTLVSSTLKARELWLRLPPAQRQRLAAEAAKATRTYGPVVARATTDAARTHGPAAARKLTEVAREQGPAVARHLAARVERARKHG